MKILVLNGSPRPAGNTSHMIAVFKDAAEAAGHQVDVVSVCRMDIHGCLACEYCHEKSGGICIQQDDMQEIYPLLKEANMLVLGSPIYYHNLSGQIKCAIDRFYAVLYPKAPENLQKVAMFLSSGDDHMDTGARFSYEGDFVDYLGLKDCGLFTDHDEDVMQKIAAMAKSL